MSNESSTPAYVSRIQQAAALRGGAQAAGRHRCRFLHQRHHPSRHGGEGVGKRPPHLQRHAHPSPLPCPGCHLLSTDSMCLLDAQCIPGPPLKRTQQCATLGRLPQTIRVNGQQAKGAGGGLGGMQILRHYWRRRLPPAPAPPVRAEAACPCVPCGVAEGARAGSGRCTTQNCPAAARTRLDAR